MFVGSTIGGFIPALWGGGIMSDIILSGAGALAGIWVGFRISQY